MPLLLIGCGGEFDEGPDAIASETASDALIGGIATNDRPAIGKLDNCTATLVDRRYVLSAAHCFNYLTGPTSNGFTIRDVNGAFVERIPIDYAYALGAAAGTRDVAFARLERDAPSSVAPVQIATTSPSAGDRVTAFGFGCQSRPTGSRGWKQYRSYDFGDTSWNCRGDSGGPRTFGNLNVPGAIWGVNSGYYRNSGIDILGSTATTDAHEVLIGLRRLGHSTERNHAVAQVPAWSTASGVSAFAGDFDGDGRGDVAMVGGSTWSSIPVAFGNGSGRFPTVTNHYHQDFAGWAAHARFRVAGDFDGDGDTDIALLGNSGWTTLPVAFSNGNGIFTIRNYPVPSLHQWALASSAKAVVGDFNADGRDDIALAGGSGWGSLPVAFSNGNGTFNVVNHSLADFPGWAAHPDATLLAGDFDGDGDDDLALSGVGSWGTIPTALSNGNGTFAVRNRFVSKFPKWASTSGVMLVTGDFDGDGRDDIAAAGGSTWRTVAFAFARGAGVYTTGNLPLPNFPSWARAARHLLAGRVDADGRDDLMMLGGSGWNSIPVVFTRE